MERGGAKKKPSLGEGFRPFVVAVWRLYWGFDNQRSALASFGV